MDTAPWPQGIGMMKPLEEVLAGSAGGGAAMSSGAGSVPSSTLIMAQNPQQVPTTERRTRPAKEHALNCPRCNSTNTKFCYYNNYSMTQPRYFCKTCRRYWTDGGSLRNVPVGGGSRKNKRSSSSSSSSSSSVAAAAAARNPVAPIPIAQNQKFHHGQDLNLACFPDPPSLSAMDFLRGGGMASRGLQSPFLMAGDAVFSSGFEHIHEFRQPPAPAPELLFPLDSASGGGGGAGGSGGRLLFPFEDLRQVSSSAAAGEELVKGGAGAVAGGEGEAAAAAAAAAGFWSGMMGGGGNGGSW